MNGFSVAQLHGFSETKDHLYTVFGYAEKGDLLKVLNDMHDPFDKKWYVHCQKQIAEIGRGN